MGFIQDTICALSTPSGHGALAVIRLSGNDSMTIASKVLKPMQLKKSWLDANPRTQYLCQLHDQENIIDECLVCWFHNPHSYTGEDVVEISCHGSVYIQQQILKVLILNGARLAQPGEYTMRAYLNGKMDLSQAEAVADLIASNSRAAHQVAMNQMKGGFSHQLDLLRQQLLHFISMIELELDFSEEDVEFANRDDLKELILTINTICKNLADSFRLGNVIKNGVPVAIVGKPNSGKSTLLNVLLNEEKAIVSEIPGTTRDVIEDVISVQGLQVRFIDTAGIRDTDDTIENLGIERTFQKIRNASVILFLTDVLDNIEDTHNQLAKIHLNENQAMAIVMNKIDKLNPDELQQRQKLMSDLPFTSITISAKKRLGLEQLYDFILNSVQYNQILNNEIIITNARHFESLTNTYHSGLKVLEGIENKTSSDFLAEEVREMLRYIAEITGTISTDEVLGNIFKNFCIGK